MSYNVKVDVSPIYEFLSSFMIYTTRSWTSSLDLGAEWLAQTREKLPEKEAALIDRAAAWPFDDYDILFALAIRRRPKMRVTHFLKQLQNATAEALHASIADFLPALTTGAVELVRSRYFPLLHIWYERYFQYIEPEHELYLREDVFEKKTLQNKMDPQGLIELATSGIIVGDHLSVKEVVLLPTLHLRPLNTYCFYNQTLMIQYPIDFPEKDEQPPNVLLRLTRALADPERLKLLRFIASGGPRSLEEIRQGMPESGDELTSDLMMLRVAGLLRIHLEKNRQEKYSLREDGAAELQIFLESYIQV
ncbi:winged helix-turn-helix domain-containing protein [Paenibacillus caui]|uniref:winged helix-turn-helix domain-containing protein n=1 Tax=Paenibacillus caui TaxID=2873927 RepID=UPI001CA8A0D2|nr:helix-turn-helix domain-containing protein [Paenibacillus caui]